MSRAIHRRLIVIAAVVDVDDNGWSAAAEKHWAEDKIVIDLPDDADPKSTVRRATDAAIATTQEGTH